MSIDLLCTWVRSPDEDEWKNVVRVIRYTRGIVHMPLIPRANVLSVIKWWVDASFATNPDCKGHTGAMVFMRSLLTMEILWKKKINGGSSTEADIVGADNALPQCL